MSKNITKPCLKNLQIYILPLYKTHKFSNFIDFLILKLSYRNRFIYISRN